MVSEHPGTAALGFYGHTLDLSGLNCDKENALEIYPMYKQ